MQQKMLHQVTLLSLTRKTLGQFNQRFGQILQNICNDSFAWLKIKWPSACVLMINIYQIDIKRITLSFQTKFKLVKNMIYLT